MRAALELLKLAGVVWAALFLWLLVIRALDWIVFIHILPTCR